MMSFEKFTVKMKETVDEILGAEYYSELKRMPKNNGTVLTGLTAGKADCMVQTVVYLESYYQAYLETDGEEGIEKMAEEISRYYIDDRREKLNQEMLGSIQDMFDYETIKDRIIFELVHAERNREQLQDTIWIPFYDLAVTFRLYIKEDGDGVMSLKVSREMELMWNVSLEEVFVKAKENMERLFPACIVPMSELLGELIGICSVNAEEDPVPFYVLTNRKRTMGATTLLYQGVLNQFAETVGSDFYIIPSSVDELILLPDMEGMDAETLNEMVKQVNYEVVSEEKQLSDHVYRYRKETKEIVSIEGGVKRNVD